MAMQLAKMVATGGIIQANIPVYNTRFRHPSELEYLRVTSLKTFENCPFTWARKYLPAEGVPEERSGAAAIGTAVHAICEDFLMQLHADGYEPVDQTDNWMLIPGNEITGEKANVTKYLNTLAELDCVQALCVEERFYHRMRPDAPPISGMMDFVCEMPGKRLLILDHKTNRGYNNKDWWAAQMQQLMYGWMARIEYPGYDTYSFRIGYPNLGNYVQWDTNPNDDIALKARFDGIWERMLQYAADGDWPQKVNDECNWCDFKDSCEVRKNAVHSLRESFTATVGVKPATERLKYLQDVDKILKGMIERTKGEVSEDIKARGGSLTTTTDIWTLETGQTRVLDPVQALSALNWYSSEHPEAADALKAVIADVFKANVTGVDRAAAKYPEIGDLLTRYITKEPNANPTLKATPIKGAIQR